MLKNFLLIHFFLFIGFAAASQVPSLPNSQTISQVKVDNLTDSQINQIVDEMKKNGLKLSDIDAYAEQKGIPTTEVSKLKDRIRALGLDVVLDAPKNVKSNNQQGNDMARAFDTTNIYKINPQDKKSSKIFGVELFSNKNLTFEPNLRMPTPANYRLSAEDELIIDVYGYSELTSKLKVSPDGYIRFPNLGPIYVNGLTIEEARNRITKQLSTIYSGIKNGNTSVQITLGNIRSIRVLLIGEIERPGSYTLPSLASVANALYVSGGPNENGSLRTIQVIRNGQVISTFDLYDFLMKGDLSGNIVLQDQDIVKVNPYDTRVEILGAVKRPAIFEAKSSESLSDIMKYAGGYTTNAYTEIIKAYRNNNRQKEVVNVSNQEINSFKLKSGDQFFVDSILERFTNRISISGAVFHPGDYALVEGMNVTDLIKKADGLTENAALSRGLIQRLQDDYTPVTINFNVLDAVNDKNAPLLKREDKVIIFSKNELREDYTVNITGEVNAPGKYPYSDNMHLEDLILLANGFNDAASTKRIEVARRIRNNTLGSSSDTIAIIQQFDLNMDLSGTSNSSQFVLSPFDEITVRKAPSYFKQENIRIDGEVIYPGSYAISNKQERISDVIGRAGGFKAEAYPEGAVLLRRTFVNASDSAILANKLELLYNKLQDSTDITRVKNAVERREQLLGINLDKIMSHPGSKYDLLLIEGDIIKVPKKLQTVQLFGEIYFPKKVRYESDYKFRDYIRGAGGFTEQSLKRRSYIVYSNGEIKNTKKIFFFNRYPKVKPGAEIYVPNKKAKKGLSTQEAVGLLGGLASIALIVVTILNTTK
ncbi:capsule biosynthesis protein [Chitinophaga silvatica]|uniref:Capsule biosynthesis protein n=1 Tax=Chitinophaga silvatica TaxID=2282649 RepID=A0A3E1YCD1_9BACT|nr:SLBB domain-containing protein [Chitinophaga silvatica]RFS23942.1 capsule biosynthesis protein [Chitinophaga silvatica]